MLLGDVSLTVTLTDGVPTFASTVAVASRSRIASLAASAPVFAAPAAVALASASSLAVIADVALCAAVIALFAASLADSFALVA